MLRNYIKIAWRNFTRNKFYSLINVFGLALGLACLILITLFVTDELSYDNFHEKGDQIQLVAQESKFGKSTNRGLSTPFPLGSTMENTIPEVENYITATWPGSGSVSVDGEEYIDEEHILHSTKNFFTTFSFPLKVGNPEEVLSEPNAVVLTEKMAQKYFPEQDAIGKTIYINRYDDLEFVVAGIAENINKNSYLEFDFVASIARLSNVESNRDSWGSRMYQTYVTLQDGAEWKQVETGVASITETNTRKETNVQFFPIAIGDLYLSDLVTVEGFKGSVKYIYIFSAIAFFILLLACINYMNLATARAMKRSREVGIRKVVGAGRGQLIRQFISEAMVITLAAFLFGLLLAELFLPFFNNFVGKELTLNLFSNGLFFVSLFGGAILVGLFSGCYPAFFLSRFKPVETLKTGRNTLLSGAGLRKTLVVVQFTVSTALIISTLIVLNQLDYVQQKDLGFESEQVMYIPAYQVQGELETFKDLALKHAGVINASAATDIPGQFGMRMSAPFDPQQPENEFAVYSLRSDTDYKNVLGLELAAGRYFLKERSTDPDTARVINEAMLNELGWGTPEEAIGKELRGGKKVIGVLRDFHFKSLHEKISPVLIQMKPKDAGPYENYSLLTVRFNPEDVDGVISHLQKQWSSMVAEDPMTYYFLDDKFAEQYATDQKLSNAFSVFALLSVLIACMGLLGLAAFAAERRTKEIGIRKVLGATVTNIVGLLSKDFLKLVALGFIIAVPIAYYAMNQWLADFAYKIEIGPGIFFLAGGLALLIALATVSWQSVKAALSNPVDSLRSE